MADILSEGAISLSAAGRIMDCSPCSAWRFCRKGVNGRRLEYIRIGRSIRTSAAAVSRFVAAVSAADEPIISDAPKVKPSKVSARPQGRRDRDVAAAQARLAAAGI